MGTSRVVGWRRIYLLDLPKKAICLQIYENIIPLTSENMSKVNALFHIFPLFLTARGGGDGGCASVSKTSQKSALRPCDCWNDESFGWLTSSFRLEREKNRDNNLVCGCTVSVNLNISFASLQSVWYSLSAHKKQIGNIHFAITWGIPKLGSKTSVNWRK